MSFELSPDYNTVAERLVEFREKYPTGCLRPADLARPYSIEVIAEQAYVVTVRAAYRDPDDPCPGIGTAWEPVPGRTPYTRGSEIMNAETSAWGRALVAVGAADAKRGVASAEEVANRAPERQRRAPRTKDGPATQNELAGMFADLNTREYKGNTDEDKKRQIGFICSAIGREINSRKELTSSDVAAVRRALREGASEDKTEVPT
jgi:hypothetical protein